MAYELDGNRKMTNWGLWHTFVVCVQRYNFFLYLLGFLPSNEYFCSQLSQKREFSLRICQKKWLSMGTRIGHTETLKPNRSLDLYGAICYREQNFLPSFIFLLVYCCSFVLAVARYVFELTNNHLLNNQMKSVQDLMTDLG